MQRQAVGEHAPGLEPEGGPEHQGHRHAEQPQPDEQLDDAAHEVARPQLLHRCHRDEVDAAAGPAAHELERCHGIHRR
ncbi:hypothetical protein GCM10012283_07730 [Phycicoccus endophyticus]|nr:hypothetical protein GCM10012283_07730 [Phycicoccus endophyticus]